MSLSSDELRRLVCVFLVFFISIHGYAAAQTSTQPSCGLDMKSFSSNSTDLAACKGQSYSRESCCQLLKKGSSELAYSNTQLYLAAITVTDLNKNCQQSLKVALNRSKISQKTFQACDLHLLSLVSIEESNSCPVTQLQDVEELVSLRNISGKCDQVDTACSECNATLTAAGEVLAGGSADSTVVNDCASVVFFHLAQQQSSTVSPALTTVQLTAFCTADIITLSPPAPPSPPPPPPLASPASPV